MQIKKYKFAGRQQEKVIVLASWKEPDDVNDHWDDLWEYLNYMTVKYKGYRVGGVQ